MKLICTRTGRVLLPGDTVTTFRGTLGTLTHSTPPHKPSSTGRVYVMLEGEAHSQAFFPSVIGAEFSPRTDREEA